MGDLENKLTKDMTLREYAAINILAGSALLQPDQAVSNTMRKVDLLIAELENKNDS